MKTKFLAGLIATLIALVLVIGLSLFLAIVLEIDASKNWFTTTAAFLTIGSWLGVYKWLKPKGEVQRDKYGFVIDPEVEQIDNSTFKKAYLKTAQKGFAAGIFLVLFGLPAAICILIFAGLTDGTTITGFIMLMIFGLLGIMVIVITSKKKAKIKDGSDPLIQALDTNDQQYVVWFHGVVMEMQGSTLKELQRYMVSIYSSEMKKAVTVSIKNEKSYKEILHFLGTKFPTAETGYDAETKRRMKAKYGFKGLL